MPTQILLIGPRKVVRSWLRPKAPLFKCGSTVYRSPQVQRESLETQAIPSEGVTSSRRIDACGQPALRIDRKSSCDHQALRGHVSLSQLEGNDLVKLQFLLRKESRTSEGIAAVKRIAMSLGIVPTASGVATVSAEMQDEAFESLFAQKLQDVGPRPPAGTDFGSPGGSASGPLEVPERLREHVASVSVASPYTRMTGSHRNSEK